MKHVAKFLRPVARLYPIQMGKGWIAYLLKDQNGFQMENWCGRLRACCCANAARLYVQTRLPFRRSALSLVLTAVFKKLVQPGDVCFDAGASFGFYTCAFALWGARVYAFEPVPTSFALNAEAGG